VLIWLGLTWCGTEAWGIQREIRTRLAHYDDTPVIVQEAKVRLVQTYSAPNQFPLALAEGTELKVSRTKVRNLNRLNQQVPTYQLQGQLEVRNATRKGVDMLQLTTVFFNAFHERLSTVQESLPSTLPARQQKTIAWTKSLPDEEVFELFVVISAVRFTDGTVWSPEEELIILP
jgi:hypothetical protein